MFYIGGAGGTIVLCSNSITDIDSISVSGGIGRSVNPASHGAGGGGGGGYVYYCGVIGTSTAVKINGGSGGTGYKDGVAGGIGASSLVITILPSNRIFSFTSSPTPSSTQTMTPTKSETSSVFADFSHYYSNTY